MQRCIGQKAIERKIKGWDAFLWREFYERVAFKGDWRRISGNNAKRNVLLGTGNIELGKASRVNMTGANGYHAAVALRKRDNRR